MRIIKSRVINVLHPSSYLSAIVSSPVSTPLVTRKLLVALVQGIGNLQTLDSGERKEHGSL